MSTFKNVLSTKELNTQRYREWYQRERKPKLYHPVLHIGFNVGVLFLLIIVNFYLVKSWNLTGPLILGFIFLLGNFVVWFFHRYPLHRRLKIWTFPYDTHTVEHHRYFTYESITYDNARDFVAIFFPSAVIAAFALVAQPAFYFSGKFFLGKDVGHLLAGGAAFYFLMYEFVHWASHLPSSHPLMKLKWLNYMRVHHRIHHNTKLMSRYNFCIVYPLMDILLKTKYLGTLPGEEAGDHFDDVRKNFKEKL
jgi:hypothetical protein